jgi:hypothetical protein
MPADNTPANTVSSGKTSTDAGFKINPRPISNMQIRDRETEFGRWRLACPYGLWTCADGREVLFNRYYHPVYQRYPGQPACPADPVEWGQSPHPPIMSVCLHGGEPAVTFQSFGVTDSGCTIANAAGGKNTNISQADRWFLPVTLYPDEQFLRWLLCSFGFEASLRLDLMMIERIPGAACRCLDRLRLHRFGLTFRCNLMTQEWIKSVRHVRPLVAGLSI